MTDKESLKLAISILQCFQMAYLYKEYKEETPFSDEDYDKMIEILQKIESKID